MFSFCFCFVEGGVVYVPDICGRKVSTCLHKVRYQSSMLMQWSNKCYSIAFNCVRNNISATREMYDMPFFWSEELWPFSGGLLLLHNICMLRGRGSGSDGACQIAHLRGSHLSQQLICTSKKASERLSRECASAQCIGPASTHF
jgi:hypothetical protein